MREMFAGDPQRFERFSLNLGDILFDYSKNRITEETMTLLRDLARQAGVEERRRPCSPGPRSTPPRTGPCSTWPCATGPTGPSWWTARTSCPGVNAVLAQMKDFSDRVRSGQWRGFTDKPITDVVNIGIGGSDLGPQMAVLALAHYAKPGLACHFVSNVDGTHLAETVKALNPETTLFIVASKTFTTQETMANAAIRPGPGSWSGPRIPRGRGPALRGPVHQQGRAWPSSASTRPTCSSSGTGWADATPCGRPSACPSPWPWALDRFEELLKPAPIAADEHFRTAPHRPPTSP